MATNVRRPAKKKFSDRGRIRTGGTVTSQFKVRIQKTGQKRKAGSQITSAVGLRTVQSSIRPRPAVKITRKVKAPPTRISTIQKPQPPRNVFSQGLIDIIGFGQKTTTPRFKRSVEIGQQIRQAEGFRNKPIPEQAASKLGDFIALQLFEPVKPTRRKITSGFIKSDRRKRQEAAQFGVADLNFPFGDGGFIGKVRTDRF